MLSLSGLPTARLCRELAKVPDQFLVVVAKHLDMPMEDAETVDFLRHAFREVDKELHTTELQGRIARINGETE